MFAMYACDYTTHPPPPPPAGPLASLGIDAAVMTLYGMYSPFSFFFAPEFVHQSIMWGAVISHVYALWLSL